MIIVDFIGHMTSTENEEELHKFARRLGYAKCSYLNEGPLLKRPHYYLATSQEIEKALELGAEQVSPNALCLREAWWVK